jgi:hypothetical protein
MSIGQFKQSEAQVNNKLLTSDKLTSVFGLLFSHPDRNDPRDHPKLNQYNFSFV